MTFVIATAIVWGMLSYSIAVLGIVVGLAVKMALLFKDRGVLRMELADAERRVKDAIATVEGSHRMVARYRKELEVLRDELEQDDRALDAGSVAVRLKRLLSGEVSKDDPENGKGGSPVSTSTGTDSKPGKV